MMSPWRTYGPNNTPCSGKSPLLTHYLLLLLIRDLATLPKSTSGTTGALIWRGSRRGGPSHGSTTTRHALSKFPRARGEFFSSPLVGIRPIANCHYRPNSYRYSIRCLSLVVPLRLLRD